MPSAHIWPALPRAHSVAVTNPASERRGVLSPALSTHQGHMSWMEEGGWGCACTGIWQEMGTLRLQKQRGIAWHHAECPVLIGEGKQFYNVPLTNAIFFFFFSAILMFISRDLLILVD